MTRSCRGTIAWVATTVLGLASGRAGAEGFLDIYAGVAFTDDSTLDFTVSGLGSLSAPANWKNSAAGGIRGGYWFTGPANWLGVGADLSYFQPHLDFAGTGEFDYHLIPLSPMVFARLPIMPSEDHPGGQIQPYVGVGPGLFLSVANFAAAGLGSATEIGFDVGADVRAGLALQLVRHFGLFVEYRYTHVSVNIEDEFGDEVDTQLDSHHINAGVALRF